MENLLVLEVNIADRYTKT